MKKYTALFAAAIIAVTCFGSCGRKDTETIPEKDTLNDWQKEILAAEGLPTEADQLTSSQLRSIQRIYEMITYLNEKYNEEFIYAGYLEPASNQTETLYAYPRLLGADYGRNTVTVKASGKEFTDDYSDRSIVDYAEEMANDFMKDYFDSDQVIAFFRVNACEITKSEMEGGDFQWKLGVSDIIFVNEDICNKDQVEEFAVNYAKWLCEHRLDGRHRINIIRDVDVKEITYGKIVEYYEDSGYIGDYTLSFGSLKNKVIYSSSFEPDVKEIEVNEYFSKYK